MRNWESKKFWKGEHGAVFFRSPDGEFGVMSGWAYDYRRLTNPGMPARETLKVLDPPSVENHELAIIEESPE
jgi:hypothetical protein